ncbi:thiomuracin/GE37468 family thiazolyl RiPP peptide [Spongiactinospora sp. TRM90649]|uniref:thiomuracin/GE37468 family thiazolyl RiPP peptide n=1 Tax=Spongiactinospora sp. TRM90649 TaxID=3031114 RepID=UPI0023F7EDCE|nr:thiomuracin/GE37468 family thiazolyl RiPP peptide [Spongiactinospora sp. TRM90649]MDF5756351.1 hypothetical protein [Spongiactinospora sp. TRM90649]
MPAHYRLALDLGDLEIEEFQSRSGGGLTLESMATGHGMTELTASVGVPSCSGSCCVGCCCCCWD